MSGAGLNAGRYAAMCAVLGAFILLAFVALASWDQARRSRAQEDAALANARMAQRFVEAQHQADIARRGELVADDPAFAGYVEIAIGGALPGMEVDTTSLVDLLEERRETLGFAFVAVLDPNGRVVGSTHLSLAAGSVVGADVFRQARDRDATAVGPWLDGERLMHVAVVPLAAVGVSEGFVFVGMPVEDAFIGAINKASGADAAVFLPGARDPLASTLGRLPPPRGLDASAARVPAPAGGSRAASLEPLFGTRTAAVVLVAPPPSLPPLSWLPWLLALVLVELTLVAAAWLAWRRLFSPIALLSDRLDRAAAGGRHLQMAEGDAGLLLAPARAFNRLMASLSS